MSLHSNNTRSSNMMINDQENQLMNVKSSTTTRGISNKPSSQINSTRQFGNNITNNVQAQAGQVPSQCQGNLKKRTSQTLDSSNIENLGIKCSVPQLVASKATSNQPSIRNQTTLHHRHASSTTLPSTQANKIINGSHKPSSSLITQPLPSSVSVSIQHQSITSIATTQKGDDIMLIDSVDTNYMLEDSVAELTLQQHSTTTTSSATDSSSFPLARMPSELTFTTPAANPQYEEKLISSIIQNMKSDESQTHLSTHVKHIHKQYMSLKQHDINARMREILVDWLIEVHLKFKLQAETLYLTINYVDRFLNHQAINRTSLQLVGCTAMLLASKYEEIYAPEVNDFVTISDRAYTREQILQMEQMMLNTLQFQLTTHTIYRFTERYTRIAIQCVKPLLQRIYGTHTDLMIHQLEYLTKYLGELTLQNYSFLQYPYSMVACSSLAVALFTITQKQQKWYDLLEQESEYSLSDMQACIRDIYELAVGDQSKYRAVRKKFSHRKFYEVSKMQIASPLM